MNNRKIVYHVTREYMKQNKKRTFTTFLGIVFMVMLMTCVFVGKDTAVVYLQDIASNKQGKWHISIYDVDIKQYQKIRNLACVDKTAVSADYGVAEFAQSENESRPFIQVKAYSEHCFDWMNIKLSEGRLPQNTNEIVLCKSAVEDGAKLQIGDVLSASFFRRRLVKTGEQEEKTHFPYYDITLTQEEPVEVPQGFPYFGENDSFMEEHIETGITAEYEIVGFIETPNYENIDAAAYTALTWLEVPVDLPEQFNVSLQLDFEYADSYMEDLQACGISYEQMELNNFVLSFTGDSGDATIDGMVTVMAIFFVVLIIAASVILIYNVFNMSFEERSKYLGMLSSVGATGKQKRSSVYYEAFSLLGTALPVGFLVGMLVVKLGMMALKPYIDKVMVLALAIETNAVVLQISWEGVLLTAVLSVFTVAVSAFLPARKIGKIGPIECIRGNVTGKQKMYPVNKIGWKCFGAEGLLAGNALKREKKKTRSLIGATTVFMVILIVTVFSTRMLTKMISYILVNNGDVERTEDYDYAIYTYNKRGEEYYQNLKKEIRQSDNVESVTESLSGMFVGSVPVEVYSKEYWKAHYEVAKQYGYTEETYKSMMHNYETMGISVMAFDELTLKKIMKLTGMEPDGTKNSDYPPAIMVQSGEVSTQNWIFEGKAANYKFYEIEHMTDLQIGDVLPLEIYNYTTNQLEEYPMEITGFATNEKIQDYLEFHTEQMWIITDLKTAEELNTFRQVEQNDDFLFSKTLTVKMKDMDNSLAQQLQELAYDAEGFIRVSPNPKQMLTTIAEALNAIIRIMLICFVLLTSVICLLNLYNSIRGRIVGKKKEYAILQSLGMTRVQLRKMLFLESGGVLIKSIVLAMLVSTPLVLFVKYKLIEMYGYVEQAFPWNVYLIAILVATLAVMAITMFCYRFEKTENILEDIRMESV